MKRRLLSFLPAGLPPALRLLAGRPRRVLGVLALVMLASATEGFGLLLLVPLLAMVGLDIPAGSMESVAAFFERAFGAFGIRLTLPLVLASYVGVVTAQAAIQYQEKLRTAALVESCKIDLRNRLFGSVAQAGWPFHLRTRGSDVLHVLTEEVSRAGDSVGLTLRLATMVATAAVYLGIALYFSPLATGVALIAAASLLLILRGRAARSQEAGEGFSGAAQAMYFSASEFLAGMKTAKSHATEDHHTQVFEAVTTQVSHSWLRAVRSYADVQFLFTTGAVVVLSLLVYVALEVMGLEAAALLVLIFIFVRLMPRFSGMQAVGQHLANALPAHLRVETLLQEAQGAAEVLPMPGADTPTLEAGIRLVAITYRYPERGNHPALRDLTLNIPARRTTAVVGPSGSGKTTVADLVIGLLRPTEGDVLVEGTPLNDIDLRQWRRRIGYVPQESFLFNDTVRANLLWGSESAITDEELMEALRIVRLEELIASLPRGLDTLVGERGVHMSGGERQRLALARALLRRPRLLILDEATSSLDYENEALIQRAVEALHGGMTVLLITHRLPIVRHADTIHVLDRGRLVESGNWNELMREGTRFAELSRAYQRTEGSPSSVALSVAEAPAQQDAEVRIG